MSRRSRKRRGESGGSKWLVAVVAVLVLMVVAVGVVHTMIRSYLHSDEFRIFLSEKVSEAIGVEGEFKPLRWDGLAVRSEGFQAEGREQIRLVNIEGLRTEIGLGGFWSGLWEVQGFQVRQVEVELDARSGVEPAMRREKKSKDKSGWLPSEVEMKNLRIERVAVKALLDSGVLSLRDSRVDAVAGTTGQTYELAVSGGELSLPDPRIPKIRLENADIRYRNGAVFLTHADARFWDKGRLELSGEWDPALDIRGAQGHVNGVTCDQLVSDDWSKRIRGKLSSDFELAWVGEDPIASGHAVLQDGVLTALPILDVMEAYLDTTRFRVLTLNEASADWRWREGQWSVSNVVISSEGLMSLEGEMRVVGDNIDGNFRLGLAPGTLASIPGAEEHVFLPGERGLRWAPVRLTGTLSDPKHDLTQRLMEAAGRRMLEALPEQTLKAMLMGKGMIDASTQKALQESLKLLGGDAQDIERAIQQGVDGAVEGVLRGIFGGSL